jgi:phytoene dehydrogenase-like protein
MIMSFAFWSFLLGIDPLIITGISLWALTLYLSFARLRHNTMEGLMRWLNFGERSPQPKTASEKPHLTHELQREFWASLLSIVPFLIGGGLCYYSIVVGLGQSWAISIGLMGVILSGIYELARVNGASH